MIMRLRGLHGPLRAVRKQNSFWWDLDDFAADVGLSERDVLFDSLPDHQRRLGPDDMRMFRSDALPELLREADPAAAEQFRSPHGPLELARILVGNG